MKLIKCCSVLLLLVFATSVMAQKSVPSIEVKTLKGKKVDIQDYAKNGKITVLSFWATWCSPCKKELDVLADLYPEWQDAYDMEIVAVTIDTRRAVAKVPGLVASKGWEFDILSDENQACQNALNFQTIPQTFLIDQDGNIAYIHNGYVPGDEYELEDKIKALTAKSK